MSFLRSLTRRHEGGATLHATDPRNARRIADDRLEEVRALREALERVTAERDALLRLLGSDATMRHEIEAARVPADVAKVYPLRSS